MNTYILQCNIGGSWQNYVDCNGNNVLQILNFVSRSHSKRNMQHAEFTTYFGAASVAADLSRRFEKWRVKDSKGEIYTLGGPSG